MSKTNHEFLISQNNHADLKGSKMKYKLHYGGCTGRRFTAATLHNTSGSESKKKKKKKKKISSLKSNENIYKKEDGHTT